MPGSHKPPVNGPLVIGALVVACAFIALAGGGTKSPKSTEAAQAAPKDPPEPAAEPKLPELTATEQRDTIALVRNQWRSESGEKADAILDIAAKVAHFYRRGAWEAYRDSDG